jgi:hypothetical protein
VRPAFWNRNMGVVFAQGGGGTRSFRATPGFFRRIVGMWRAISPHFLWYRVCNHFLLRQLPLGFQGLSVLELSTGGGGGW